jgi:hypothetical protein
MRHALLPLVLILAGTSACATSALPSESAAVRRGCAAIHARLPRYRVPCAALEGRQVNDGTQWLVSEREDHLRGRDGGVHALFWTDGRLIKVWAGS